MKNSNLDQTAQIIYYITGAINVVLLLRLLFKTFGANPASGIVNLIYSLTNILLIPFRGIFSVASSGQMVVEPSVLVALLIYSLLAKGLVELIYIAANKQE